MRDLLATFVLIPFFGLTIVVQSSQKQNSPQSQVLSMAQINPSSK